MSNDVVKDMRATAGDFHRNAQSMRDENTVEGMEGSWSQWQIAAEEANAIMLDGYAERVDNALTNLARRVVETSDVHNRMYREIESFYLWMVHKEGTETTLTPSVVLGEFESKPFLKAMVDAIEHRFTERARSH